MLNPIPMKMNKLGTCHDFRSTFSETVIVTIDLSEDVMRHIVEGSVARLDKLLASGSFSIAIDKALSAYVRKEYLSKDLTKSPTSNPFNKNVKRHPEFDSVAKLVEKDASDFLTQVIKIDADAIGIKGHLSRLKEEFSKTKTGVFIDKRKKALILVGSLTVIGGVLALYKTGSGDGVMSSAGWVIDKLAKKIDIGKIDIGFKDMEFKPSEKIAAGTVKISPHLKESDRVKGLNFELNTKFDNTGFTSGYLGNEMKIKLTNTSTIGYKAKTGLTNQKLNYEYFLNVNYSKKNTKIDLQAYVKADELEDKKDIGGKLSLNAPYTIENKKTGKSSKINAYLGSSLNQSLTKNRNFTFTVDFGVRWIF